MGGAEAAVAVQTASPGQARPTDSLAGRLTEAALNYQRVLAQDPRHPEALLGISLVALASGQHAAAVQMASAAVGEAPALCAGWIALGQALKAAGRFEDAEQAYRRAIRLDGANPLSRSGLGELKLAMGRPDAAVPEFEIALRHRPGLVAAQMGLGHALACMGRNRDALVRYEEALALSPRLPEAEFAAGFVLARLGQPAEAERRYRRALAVRPDFAAAWLNLGSLLREQGCELPAEAALLRALQLRPDLVSGWLNLALVERDRRRPERAEAHLRKALDIAPNDVEALVAWCQFRNAENDPAGAWDWLGKAFAANPRHAEALNMRGILLHNQGCFEEAIAAFKDAESLGSHAASSNRGNSLLELGRDTEALRAHEAAVERDPHTAGHVYNLALTRLRLGNWARGWRDYESRWCFREVHRTARVFSQPRWQGEPLQDRRILLHAEQGLGDAIQFSRYAALVADRGGRVILQVHEPLVRLMRSLPVVRAGLAEIAAIGQQSPPFDFECPLMSLPAVLSTTIETVPWTGAYLAAEPALEALKRIELPSAHPGPRVGIAWAGNPRYKADRQRSTTLKTLIPLLTTPGTQWISLQKSDPAASQIASLPLGISIIDGSSRDADLAETAALISTLDLVVTTDTSIAHLAGAMAKPVWILLPHLADWRWMQCMETTPWYPTARLFRQPSPGNWAELLGRVVIELKHSFVIA